MIFPLPPQNQQQVFRFDPDEHQIQKLQMELLEYKEAADTMESRIELMRKENNSLRQHFIHHKKTFQHTLQQTHKQYSEETARLNAVSEDKLAHTANENRYLKNRMDSLQFKAKGYAAQIAHIEKAMTELESQMKQSDTGKNESQAVLHQHRQLIMSINEKQKKQANEIKEQRNGLEENNGLIISVKESMKDEWNTVIEENRSLRNQLQKNVEQTKLNQQNMEGHSEELHALQEALRILKEKTGEREQASIDENTNIQLQLDIIRQENENSGRVLKRLKEEKKEEQKKYRADKLLADQNYQQIMNRVNNKELEISNAVEKFISSKEELTAHLKQVYEHIEKLEKETESAHVKIQAHDDKFTVLQKTFKEMLSAMEQKIGKWVKGQNSHKNE